MKKRRSSYYRFTIHGTNDIAGGFRLALLKKAVTKHNAANPDEKQRVCVKGRLGKNSLFAHLYRKGGGRAWAMRSGSVQLSHASRFDVYVYRVANKY